MTAFDYQAVADQLRRNMMPPEMMMLPMEFLAAQVVHAVADALENVGKQK